MRGGVGFEVQALLSPDAASCSAKRRPVLMTGGNGHSVPIPLAQCNPSRNNGAIPTCEYVHVLLRNAVDVHPIPIVGQGEDDITGVLLGPSAAKMGRGVRVFANWRGKASAYIIQLLSLARMNSEKVRKGTLDTCMTVVLSRTLGPLSPAGRISI